MGVHILFYGGEVYLSKVRAKMFFNENCEKVLNENRMTCYGKTKRRKHFADFSEQILLRKEWYAYVFIFVRSDAMYRQWKL